MCRDGSLGPWPNWAEIDHVVSDMDGTLLDLGFDNDFWGRLLPAQYAAANRISEEAARAHLSSLYQAQEGTLNWFDVDYWSRELGLDVVSLTAQQSHRISLHADGEVLLNYARSIGKRIYLVTNAHRKTLAIKVQRTGINQYLEKMLCAEEVGSPKSQIAFWEKAVLRLHYDPARTLFLDDTEDALRAARTHGIRYLIHRSKPSTIDPPRPSADFHSVENFHSLMP